MKRRAPLAAAALLATVYVAYGATIRARRAPRPDPPAGEVRGAFHVHTTRSDGRGTLDEVVRAAREAGLQFVVIADHDALAPDEQGWRDGVLVVEATEVSTAFGHVVALGVPRALSSAERDGDPLRAIADLGGYAVLAHPFHPRRPFTGWGRGAWRGFELVSNDTAWHRVIARREWGKAAFAALELPWDGAGAVLDVVGDLTDERSRFDAELLAARGAGGKGPARVILCSADAHGYPSYRSAFQAFSMHLPVALSRDGAAAARAVVAALADGRAACVLDGIAPASGVALASVSGKGGKAIGLSLTAPDLSRAAFTLFRDGARVATARAAERGGPAKILFDCGGACGPGDYRVEGAWEGRPWIFTNPTWIE